MTDRLQGFYSKLYLSEKHDSPDRSCISLVRRINTILNTGIPNNEVLNIGSEPQSLERQLWSMGDQSLLRNFNFSTIDVANINSKKLLGRNKSNVFHAQASGLDLPYSDESFGLVVSNHAIDFLPKSSFDEAFRVLAPEGNAVFYFHHPDMIPDDLGLVKNGDIRTFWSHLRDNNLLFDSERRIIYEMQNYGFNVESVELNNDNVDKWWEVGLIKPS